MASAAANAINTHEHVCAERWRNTMDTMNDVKRIMSWGMATLILTMLGLIGYLAHIVYAPR